MKTSHLKKLVKAMSGKRVLLLGDLVVDEYIFGETARISREAPVLILNFRRRHAGYGGAANAVANIRALGAIPLPVGCIGDDENGRTLLEKFEEDGISTEGVITDPEISTTSKTRVMAGGMHTIRQQIVRIDREPPVPHNENALIQMTKKMLDKGADAFLVSDYGCGTMSDKVIRFINRTAGAGCPPLAIDSRYHLQSYRNADLLAPNEEEAGIGEGLAADDLDTIERKMEQLRKKLKSRSLLVTRGSEGLSLFAEDEKPEHFPVYGSKAAVDTTGAGDTVVTSSLLALCAGGSYSEAAFLSNRAGGLVVMKKGAATISQDELLGTL